MRLRIHHIIIAFVVIGFYSCGKEISYEGGTPIGHDSIPIVRDSVPVQDTTPVSTLDTLQVTINGTAWVAPAVSASAISGQLGITGSGPSGPPAVSLVFPSYIEANNSYTLDVTHETTYVGIYNPTATIVLTSTGGTLTILENNTTTHRIRGNFHFQASDPSGMNTETDQLTIGYFSVYYTP